MRHNILLRGRGLSATLKGCPGSPLAVTACERGVGNDSAAPSYRTCTDPQVPWQTCTPSIRCGAGVGVTSTNRRRSSSMLTVYWTKSTEKEWLHLQRVNLTDVT